MQVGTAGIDRVVSDNTAYVLPPPGGPSLVAVSERSYSNGIQQDIALATSSGISGQNAMRVRLFGPIKGKAPGQTALPGQFLSLANIDSEIRRAVPGVPMQKAAFFVQNRYGPFGYAVGRRGRETCLYGFQEIKSREFTWNDRGSVDIRVRLCESGASEGDLLAFMYGYTVNVFVDAAGWNPYGEPAAVPEGLGAPGPDVYPTARGQLQTVLPDAPAVAPAPRVVRQKPRRAAAQPAEQAAPPPLPQPIGPTVPLPPVTADASSLTAPSARQEEFSAVPPPPSNR